MLRHLEGLHGAAMTPRPEDSRREELAALCHEQWAGWMAYLFSKCNEVGDGCMEIPAWAVERWTRQLATPYENLSEEEKDSDRKEADRFLAILAASRSGARGGREA